MNLRPAAYETAELPVCSTTAARFYVLERLPVLLAAFTLNKVAPVLDQRKSAVQVEDVERLHSTPRV